MDTFPSLSSLAELFEVLLHGSLRGTLMTGGVLALQAALGQRLSPRWRYGLWLAVAAALVLPPITLPAIDVTPLREVPVVRYVLTPENAKAPAPAIPTVTLAPPEAKNQITWMEIVALVWISGVVLVSGFWFTAHCILMRSFRRNTVENDSELIAEIEDCAASIGLRRIPHVLQGAAIPSPAVSGFWKGTLLLPADVLTRFTPAERRFMLLHELAHLRRGDLLSNWLINALLALHWFNPVLWFAATRVRADRESACDATVLLHTSSGERSAYGHTLLKLHTAVQVPHGHTAFVGILERGGSIRQRIQHIASYGSERKSWGTVAAIAAAALLSCIGVRLYAEPVRPAAEPAPAAANPAKSSLEQRLLARRSNAQQVEIEAKVFTIDPAVGPIKVGEQTLTPPKEGKASPLSVIAGVLKTEELDQLVEKLANTTGVESIATPRVTARHGQRAVLEIIKELRYATDWNLKADGSAPEPAGFETRNLGLVLEMETHVGLHPERERSVLDVNVAPQLVYFGGWRDEKLPGGAVVLKPTFIDNRKVTTSISIYQGQHVLLWWHMDLPEGKPWEFDPDLKAADVKTRRQTVLWVISPQILDVGAHNLPAEFFKPTNWETTDASVEHLLMHFKEQSRAVDPQKRGLNLVFAKPAKETPLVSLDLKGVSLIGALEHAFKAAGMRVEEQGDNTLLITAEPAPVPR